MTPRKSFCFPRRHERGKRGTSEWSLTALSLNVPNPSGKQQQQRRSEHKNNYQQLKPAPHRATDPAPGGSSLATDPRRLKRLQEVLCGCLWLGFGELLKRQLQGSARCCIAREEPHHREHHETHQHYTQSYTRTTHRALPSHFSTRANSYLSFPCQEEEKFLAKSSIPSLRRQKLRQGSPAGCGRKHGFSTASLQQVMT